MSRPKDGLCHYSVRRGGPSSGGGYDAMNFTRYEPCGRPVVEGNMNCKRCQPTVDRHEILGLERHIDRIRRAHGFDDPDWNARVEDTRGRIVEIQQKYR